MTGYRWNSSRARRRLRRSWRKRRVLQAAGRRKRMLRCGLFVLTGAGLLAGAGQMNRDYGGRIRLIRMEKEYCLEWQNTDVSEDHPGEQLSDTVYGIRLDPGRFEIQFYQQKQMP